ncbi:retrovirus-related pol polyprotein from transposon TNT 1-94 [Tanacetum coccineum]
MKRKERVTRNVLDVVIQVISLAIVQKHLTIKIKRLSLEVLGAIARMTPKTKPTTKLVSWLNRQMSANSLREMLNNQKSPIFKIGLGFDSDKVSTSGTKTISFGGSSAENVTDGSTIKGHGSTLPGSNSIDELKKPSLKPLLKSGIGNIQVKDNKIDLLVQQYEQITILKEESIGSGFARFNTIITSFKALDEGSSIIAIRTDHGQEFDNEVQFGAYCDAQGITHNFLALRTPQSNGVVERKNRTLQEMSRTMLNEQSIPQKFWCNAVDTSTYILNRILIRPILGKTPYEIFRGRKPSLEYFKVFGSKCFILNTKDYLTKFDPKSYEGVFLGYSQNSKAYVVLNKHTMKVEESLNVTFDESPPPTKLSPLVDDDVGEEEAIKKNTKVVNNNNEEDESIEVDEIVNIKESKNHPLVWISEKSGTMEFSLLGHSRYGYCKNHKKTIKTGHGNE